MKVRKKPVVVDAMQWKGLDFGGLCDWVCSLKVMYEWTHRQQDESVIIHTLEGEMRADKGDWIIVGVKGEQYPCKPDIFEQTYEVVADATEGESG